MLGWDLCLKRVDTGTMEEPMLRVWDEGRVSCRSCSTNIVLGLDGWLKFSPPRRAQAETIMAQC